MAPSALRSKSNAAIRFYSWTHNINDNKITELKDSALNHNIKVKYLGTHLKCFGSTFTKALLLYDELCKLDENDIVCAVDAFDVFFCAGEDAIKNAFLSFNCDCIVSAEREYSQQYKVYKHHYEERKNHSNNDTHQSPYIYLNAGSIIGYVGALKKLYAPTIYSLTLPRIFRGRIMRIIKRASHTAKKIFNLEKFDAESIVTFLAYTDQKHIGVNIARNPHNLRILLDYNTDIFWCCAWEWHDIEKHFSIRNGQIANIHTRNAPLIIHVPGVQFYRDVFTKLYRTQRSLMN